MVFFRRNLFYQTFCKVFSWIRQTQIFDRAYHYLRMKNFVFFRKAFFPYRKIFLTDLNRNFYLWRTVPPVLFVRSFFLDSSDVKFSIGLDHYLRMKNFVFFHKVVFPYRKIFRTDLNRIFYLMKDFPFCPFCKVVLLDSSASNFR